MRLVTAGTPVPAPSGRRSGPASQYKPRDEPYVLLKCGHVDLPWGAIRTLGKLVKDALCEQCNAWVPIERKARPIDIIGGDPADILPLDPPF
jgi:hypothetical protein